LIDRRDLSGGGLEVKVLAGIEAIIEWSELFRMICATGSWRAVRAGEYAGRASRFVVQWSSVVKGEAAPRATDRWCRQMRTPQADPGFHLELSIVERIMQTATTLTLAWVEG